MKQELINHFIKGFGGYNAIIKEEIDNAKEEHISLAYIAMVQKASNKKIIYLLGGNNPYKCPFK